MEELLRQMKILTLPSRPDDVFTLEEEEKARISSKWRLPKDIPISSISTFPYLIALPSQECVERVLLGRPWFINNNLTLVEQIEDLTVADSFQIETLVIWTQLHNLPRPFMDDKVISKLASSYGNLLEVELPDALQSHEVSIRWALSLKKPLPAGVYVEDLNNNKVWVTFAYEGIVDLCYLCGFLGHNINSCPKVANESRCSVISVGSVPLYSAANIVPCRRRRTTVLQKWLPRKTESTQILNSEDMKLEGSEDEAGPNGFPGRVHSKVAKYGSRSTSRNEGWAVQTDSGSELEHGSRPSFSLPNCDTSLVTVKEVGPFSSDKQTSPVLQPGPFPSTYEWRTPFCFQASRFGPTFTIKLSSQESPLYDIKSPDFEPQARPTPHLKLSDIKRRLPKLKASVARTSGSSIIMREVSFDNPELREIQPGGAAGSSKRMK